MIPEEIYDFNIYNEVPEEQEQDSDDSFPSDKKNLSFKCLVWMKKAKIIQYF